MVNLNNLTPTSTISYGDIHHDIYDGQLFFVHRLRFKNDFVGEWVGYSLFAHLSFHCPEFNCLHTYRACQDTWQPLFPPIFMVNIPQEREIPIQNKDVFQQFRDFQVSEG